MAARSFLRPSGSLQAALSGMLPAPFALGACNVSAKVTAAAPRGGKRPPRLPRATHTPTRPRVLFAFRWATPSLAVGRSPSPTSLRSSATARNPTTRTAPAHGVAHHRGRPANHAVRLALRAHPSREVELGEDADIQGSQTRASASQTLASASQTSKARRHVAMPRRHLPRPRRHPRLDIINSEL